MTTEEEPEVIALMRAAHEEARGYADFFQWAPNRDLEELGVAEQLCQSLELAGESSFHNLATRGRGNDPPDCQATDSFGDPVAIEVTELIDPRAIVAFKSGYKYTWADWSAEKLFIGLSRLLEAKARRRRFLKGGPYSKYVVLIHTDEPMLSYDRALQMIDGHLFPPQSDIDHAFLLISYDPKLKFCPFIRLQFDA